MASDLSAVMDTIARLKTLSERPGTPEEAAAAVAGIQRLMRRYNLTQMQVNSAARNTETGFDKVEVDLGAALQWRQTLMNSICKYGYCSYLNGPGGRMGYIVGEQHNVIVAKELYEYLVDEIERLSRVGWETYDDQWWTTKQRWTHAFRVGASLTIAQRIKDDFMSERKQQANSSTALVVVYEQDLKNAVNAYFPRTVTQRKNMTTRDRDGLERGKEAGRRINLAKQIGQ